jgi:hypothetical protein
MIGISLEKSFEKIAQWQLRVLEMDVLPLPRPSAQCSTCPINRNMRKKKGNLKNDKVRQVEKV